METLKWGIAAAGRITHDFVNSLYTIEGLPHSVVAVADVEIARSKEFAERHQIPKYYGSFDELALDPEVQIVYIGTLNPFHYAAAKLMLEHGKNVLCEKPICLHYQQAEELYRLAKEKGVFLMEGMWSKFFPSYQRLAELLSNGAIGDVTHVQVQHGFRAANVERILTRALGGSITLDIGLYAMQLGQLIYGCAPKSVNAKARLNADGVDVECQFTLTYGENRVLTAMVSGLENFENSAIITGTTGEIKLFNYWCCTALTRPNSKTENWPLPVSAAKFEFNHTNSCGLRYEAEEVRRCLQKGLLESPLYTHAMSLELLKVEAEVLRQIGVSHFDVTKHDL